MAQFHLKAVRIPMIVTTTAPKAAAAVVASTPLETTHNTPPLGLPRVKQKCDLHFWTPTHGCGVLWLFRLTNRRFGRADAESLRCTVPREDLLDTTTKALADVVAFGGFQAGWNLGRARW